MSHNIVISRRPVHPGRPSLLLDRDGVINLDTGYVCSPSDVQLLPNAARAIAACNMHTVNVIVVSNQSGLGRGYFGMSDAILVQERIESLLAQDDAFLDAVLMCGVAPDCTSSLQSWRKPAPGMILAAASLFGISPGRAAIAGDKMSDLEAAAAAGVLRGFLMTSQPCVGGIIGEMKWTQADDLRTAATFIISQQA